MIQTLILYASLNPSFALQPNILLISLKINTLVLLSVEILLLRPEFTRQHKTTWCQKLNDWKFIR